MYENLSYHVLNKQASVPRHLPYAHMILKPTEIQKENVKLKNDEE